MSTVQSGTDISLTKLTPEFKKPTEVINAVGNAKVSELVTNDKDQVVIAKEVNQELLSPQQLEKVAQQLQNFVGEMNRGLEFSVDKDSGRDVIKVIDKGTGDLVKQYPSEEVLTLVAKLSNMLGAFVDDKV